MLLLGPLLAAHAAAPAVPPAAPLPPEIQRTVERLHAAALADTNGYAIVEDLVTRIGPRLAGSPAEARARAWAAAMFRAQGFSNIRIESFPIAAWQPESQSAAVVAPESQPLVIAAIGGSPATPAAGIEGEVLRFRNMAELQQASADAVRGRMVFIDEPMARTQDGSGYGAAIVKRSACAPAAQRLGALACLIRSVGTNRDRFAHQGRGSPGDVAIPVPTAALAPPDADTLARLIARSGVPVRVRLSIQASTFPRAESGNVLAEVPGREHPEQIVLAAAHLDSWSLGQGAIDDGAGVAIITAAARLISDLPVRPKRTIRLLLAGSEEPGALGGIAYGGAHGHEQHMLAAESDGGADAIWRLRTRFGTGALTHAATLAGALAPLAIIPGGNVLQAGGGGEDVDPVTSAGVPLLSLSQDMSRYFDAHHTANDTLERIDPAQLRQNIAAWAITLYLIAEMDWDLRAGGLP